MFVSLLICFSLYMPILSQIFLFPLLLSFILCISLYFLSVFPLLSIHIFSYHLLSLYASLSLDYYILDSLPFSLALILFSGIQSISLALSPSTLSIPISLERSLYIHNLSNNTFVSLSLSLTPFLTTFSLFSYSSPVYISLFIIYFLSIYFNSFSLENSSLYIFVSVSTFYYSLSIHFSL